MNFYLNNIKVDQIKVLDDEHKNDLKRIQEEIPLYFEFVEMKNFGIAVSAGDLDFKRYKTYCAFQRELNTRGK